MRFDIAESTVQQAVAKTGLQPELALRQIIEIGLAAPTTAKMSRFAAASAALRTDAQRKHPNGMTQAEIKAIIKKARVEREATTRRA